MINVNFVGRLGADAELKKDSFQRDFVSFSVAVDEFRGGQNETAWMRVTASGDRAVKMQPYLKKGSLVSIHGVESVRLFTSASGTTGVSRDVRADRMEFVKVGAANGTTTASTTTASAPQTTVATPTQDVDMANISCGTFATQTLEPQVVGVSSSNHDDDLPF